MLLSLKWREPFLPGEKEWKGTCARGGNVLCPGLMDCGDSMVLSDGRGGCLALSKPSNAGVCPCECSSGGGEKRDLGAREHSHWANRRESALEVR